MCIFSFVNSFGALKALEDSRMVDRCKWLLNKTAYSYVICGKRDGKGLMWGVSGRYLRGKRH